MRPHKHQRHAQQGHEHDDDVHATIEQMKGGLQLHPQGLRGAPHGAQVLAGSFGRALGPAKLLRLEGIHGGGQLGGSHYFGAVHEAPTAQLGAVAQVEVFGEGVSVPAAGIGNAGAPPHAARTIKVDEVAGKGAAHLLDEEVRVQAKGLQASE